VIIVPLCRPTHFISSYWRQIYGAFAELKFELSQINSN
jgi:hypothetical protein